RELVPLDQLVLGDPARVFLGEGIAITVDLDQQALRQRVDDRDADAVQAAGDLVAPAGADLSGGVEPGPDDVDGRPALLLHYGHRDPAAVVRNGDRVVGM